MKISYLITTHNEDDTLQELLDVLIPHAQQCNDNIVIVDDYSNNLKTNRILENLRNTYQPGNNLSIDQIKLELDYGKHKNTGIELCSEDTSFIMQIDGDEIPNENIIGENLHNIIESNSSIECFVVPRKNDFVGVCDENAQQWGWRLTPSSMIVHEREVGKNTDEYIFLKKYNYIIKENNNLIKYKAPLVNWPDPQYRIYKKDYPRMRYLRKLHEKIEGYTTFALFPMEEEYALCHKKTISQQISTNLAYNDKFTVMDNKGFRHNLDSDEKI
jgi:hypothetical protein